MSSVSSSEFFLSSSMCFSTLILMASFAALATALATIRSLRALSSSNFSQAIKVRTGDNARTKDANPWKSTFPSTSRCSEPKISLAFLLDIRNPTISSQSLKSLTLIFPSRSRSTERNIWVMGRLAVARERSFRLIARITLVFSSSSGTIKQVPALFSIDSSKPLPYALLVRGNVLQVSLIN